MTDAQQKILRALIAAQVAVLEWGEEDVMQPRPVAKKALMECLRVAIKEAKRLE